MKPTSESRIGLPLKTALFFLFLFGLALSAALPFGIGVMVFFWIAAAAGALCAVGYTCFSLLREVLGKTALFGYAPTAAYMTGKKGRKGRKAGNTNEEKPGDAGGE